METIRDYRRLREFQKTLEKYPDMLPEGFSMDAFLESSPVILKDGNDYAVFERVRDKIFAGHYVFESRGKEAITKARNFLKEIFKEVDVVIGDTRGNKAASFLTRRLDFEVVDGYFYLTKDAFNG